MRAISALAIAATLLVSTKVTVASSQTQTAILAGGCYWGMEAVFEHVRGVKDVEAGFMSSEANGHAEAVRIKYDPSQVSYAQLLKIYFTVAHDPTQVNRQGPDVGPSYRSAIYPQDAQQAALARAAIGNLNEEHVFGRPLATKIESGTFYPAPPDQQDYARKNPHAAYIVVNDLPKLAQLKKHYPQWWKG